MEPIILSPFLSPTFILLKFAVRSWVLSIAVSLWTSSDAALPWWFQCPPDSLSPFVWGFFCLSYLSWQSPRPARLLQKRTKKKALSSSTKVCHFGEAKKRGKKNPTCLCETFPFLPLVFLKSWSEFQLTKILREWWISEIRTSAHQHCWVCWLLFLLV